MAEQRQCPHCGVQQEDNAGASGLFTCRDCGAEVEVRSLRAPAPKPPQPPEPKPVVARAAVPLPKGWKLEETAGNLTLEWPWSQGVGTALGGLLGIGMAAGAMWWVHRSPDWGFTQVFFGAVSVLMLYQTLAHLLNTTRIEVRKQALLISHGPIPSLGGGRYDPRQLEQLYVERVESTDSEAGTTISYHLRARLKDGRTRTLVNNLQQPELGLYLEQWLEKRYGIKDRPVLGELPRE